MSRTSAPVATGLRTSAPSGSKVALLANPNSPGWLLSIHPTSAGLFNVPFHLPHLQSNSLLRNILEELYITGMGDRVIQAPDVVPKKVTVAGCVHDQMGKATFDVDVRGDFDKNRCRQMPPLLAPGLALMASLVAKSV